MTRVTEYIRYAIHRYDNPGYELNQTDVGYKKAHILCTFMTDDSNRSIR